MRTDGSRCSGSIDQHAAIFPPLIALSMRSRIPVGVDENWKIGDQCALEEDRPEYVVASIDDYVCVVGMRLSNRGRDISCLEEVHFPVNSPQCPPRGTAGQTPLPLEFTAGGMRWQTITSSAKIGIAMPI